MSDTNGWCSARSDNVHKMPMVTSLTSFGYLMCTVMHKHEVTSNFLLSKHTRRSQFLCSRHGGGDGIQASPLDIFAVFSAMAWMFSVNCSALLTYTLLLTAFDCLRMP